VTTAPDKSSNPSTNTAEGTIAVEAATSTSPPPDTEAAPATAAEHTIATGHEGTVRDQVGNYLQRIRGGDMGMLPALAGVIVLTILFGSLSPFFLTKLNIANLLTQTAALMMLAIALTFVILIAEIDLSAGVTSGVGMAIFVLLVNKQGWNWVAALIAALVVGAVIGTFIGYFVAKVGIPSFVVTLGLFLGFQGLNLVLLGDGGLYRIETPQVIAIMNKSMPIWGGWLMLAVIIAVSLGTQLYDRRRRVAAGMAVRPMSLLWARVGIWVVGGGLVVYLLNQNRSTSIVAIAGVPVVVPLALAVLWIGTSVLDRTRFGLHIYSVGGNPEAARRAGISVARLRITAFIVCSTLAVVSGLFSASQTGTVEPSAGRDIVLSGVAAAVVGGVSLFGGRGRLVQAVIGALLISMITNGLGLLGLPAGITFLVTGGVLILAATIDALSRRRSGSSSLART
jgi:D-xylose transport system permease protein